MVAAAGGTSAAATAAWHSEQVLALSLVRRLCIALRDEFEPQLPSLVPLLLGLLHADASADRRPTLAALKTLETFGQLLDAHEYAVIPALLRLSETAAAPVTVRVAAVALIGRLTATLQLRRPASRIVQTLRRLIEEGGSTAAEKVSPVKSLSGNASGRRSPNHENGAGADLRLASLDALCCVADAIGDAFAVFVPSLSALLTRLGVHHPRYLELVGSLEPLLPPPPNNAPAAALLITAGSPSASGAASTRRSTAADSPFGLDRTPTIAASARRSVATRASPPPPWMAWRRRRRAARRGLSRAAASPQSAARIRSTSRRCARHGKRPNGRRVTTGASGRAASPSSSSAKVPNRRCARARRSLACTRRWRGGSSTQPSSRAGGHSAARAHSRAWSRLSRPRSTPTG